MTKIFAATFEAVLIWLLFELLVKIADHKYPDGLTDAVLWLTILIYVLCKYNIPATPKK